MTTWSLKDPRARAERARHHLKTLEEMHGLSSHLNRHAVRVSVHDHGLEYRLHLIETVAPLSDDIPFIVSECLFNLRSALDQLVYQLHLRRFRGKLPRGLEHETRFPILDNIKAGRSPDAAKWPEIRNLSAKHRTTIKHLQPYVQRNDYLKDTRMRLSALNSLNNLDKHRRMHVANEFVAAVSKSSAFPAHLGFRQTIFAVPLVAGAEVERWNFDRVPPEVNMDQGIWSQVVIDEPERNLRYYVWDFLALLITDVSHLIWHFERSIS